MIKYFLIFALFYGGQQDPVMQRHEVESAEKCTASVAELLALDPIKDFGAVALAAQCSKGYVFDKKEEKSG